MTRAQTALAQRWRSLTVAAVLLVLGGAVVLVWLRIDREAARGDALADEANRRGTAVTTLASDVRVLRAQIKAKGGTPAAPDPARAVKDLPDRAAVPVPIPGPPGATGPRGEPGEPGPSGSPGPTGSPGTSGRNGTDGQNGSDGVGQVGPTGPAGPQGEAGPPGQDGKDGTDGTDGQTCPAGYSLQAPAWDPNALVCRRDGSAPPSDPEPSSPSGPGILGLPAERRRIA